MPCYRPREAFVPPEGGRLRFFDRGDGRPVTIPCGWCVGCRVDKSKSWTIRALCESKLHEQNWFATLTYAPEFVPRELVRRDWQLTAKRLRKAAGPFRYMVVGEYGENLGRPHFHVIFFGLQLSDLKPWRKSHGHQVWRSAVLDAAWGMGIAEIGSLSVDSAAYVCGYIQKKIVGEMAESHYAAVDGETGELFHREPEFMLMSRRPGIGHDWLSRYHPEVYGVRDGVVVPGGQVFKPPSYFDRVAERLGVDIEGVKWERQVRASSPECRFECTEDRLRVRELVAKARLAGKSRPLQ